MAPGAAEDRAGSRVSVMGDFLVLSAPRASRGGKVGSGSLFLLEKPEGGWPAPAVAAKTSLAVISSARELLPAVGEAEQTFGSALVVGRSGVLAGAPMRTVIGATGANLAQGEADFFPIDRVFRAGFE